MLSFAEIAQRLFGQSKPMPVPKINVKNLQYEADDSLLDHAEYLKDRAEILPASYHETAIRYLEHAIDLCELVRQRHHDGLTFRAYIIRCDCLKDALDREYRMAIALGDEGNKRYILGAYYDLAESGHAPTIQTLKDIRKAQTARLAISSDSDDALSHFNDMVESVNQPTISVR